jgi:2-oxoglutarate dehydrogenase E1 component
MDLLYAYRYHGHKFADLDPLGLKEKEETPELDMAYHGLVEDDLNARFNVGVFSNYQPMALKQIIDNAKKIYCDTIGYEYMHLSSMTEKLWLRKRIEQFPQRFSDAEKKWLFHRLTATEGLEKYLGMKYIGQKRFSIEGGDSLIPALGQLINMAGEYEVDEIMMGMGHRGRLNVLVNIMGKSPEELFREFEGSEDRKLLSGDVKYHLGFSSDHQTSTNDVHLSLAFNPSHLEAVDAIVVGSARARQERRQGKHAFNKVLPVIMHGDAAFCGQGVVMETLALSQTRYFGTGGTVHIVSNNQIGFTTSRKRDARSSLYCTDIAKMIESPVFHVNGDDPEAVIRVTKLAMDYRMQFNKDVVIDIVCYRRHGHNEADDPSGTQPRMYSAIKKLPTTRSIYAQQLIDENVISKQDSKEVMKTFRAKLDEGQIVADIASGPSSRNARYLLDWTPYKGTNWRQEADTTVSKATLVELGDKINQLPDGFELQPQVKKVHNDRARMIKEEIPANWGFAEIMAYASLLNDGYNVRLSGEDSARGTFSHRHAVYHNYDVSSSHREYVPLSSINNGVDFKAIDSTLSEYGVLGFEYGYSCSYPESLVLWEAQFGDFVNTAQVVIDQFISSAEEKWGLLSGLVMLLPHGQEGMGAEHSSARLERFLQLCAFENMQVCIPSTPAQLFHMLRRQMIRPMRKPLIVMSPKSLLRHPMVTSTLDDLAKGQFYPVISEIDDLQAKKVNRVIICSGKIYYELLSKRREEKIENIAIIRLEQMYPFPDQELESVLAHYAHVEDVVWLQEEPENQGAWWMIQHEIRKILQSGQSLSYEGRQATAAPAVGYPNLFHERQQKLVERALKLDNAK